MTPLASRPASDGRKTLRRRSVVRPLQSPFHIAGRSIDAFETLVVEVSDGRRVGRGEATPVHYRGETIEGLLPAVDATLAEVEPGEGPVVVCLGAEREGLPGELLERASVRARIPLRGDGPESLNVAMAATVALYELAKRMARHA